MEKYKAELRVRCVLSYHKCGLKCKENTTEVFFPTSVHVALTSQETGALLLAIARVTYLLQRDCIPNS